MSAHSRRPYEIHRCFSCKNRLNPDLAVPLKGGLLLCRRCRGGWGGSRPAPNVSVELI